MAGQPALSPGQNKGGVDVFLAKYSPAGAQMWVRRLGGVMNEKAIGIAVGGSGDIVIAGSNDTRWFLIKFSSTGALVWSRNFNTARPADIALTSTGAIVAVAAAGDFLDQY